MYKYLYAEPTVLKKLGSNVTKIWLPFLLLRFSECKPNKQYIVDCLLRGVIDNRYVSIFTLREVPKNTKIVDTPSIEADIPVKICMNTDIATDLVQIGNDYINNNFDKLDEFITIVEEYRDVEIPTRVFLRTRRYVIPAEKIKAIDRKIAIEVVGGLIKKFCMYRQGEKTVLPPIIDIQPIYAFIYISGINAGLVIGKKIIPINIYAKLLSKQKVRRSILGS